MSGLAIGKWAAWFGGESPVTDNQMVMVIFRNRKISLQRADDLYWEWNSKCCSDEDITFYKTEGNGATQ